MDYKIKFNYYMAWRRCIGLNMKIDENRIVKKLGGIDGIFFKKSKRGIKQIK